jgi:hypothetical protein
MTPLPSIPKIQQPHRSTPARIEAKVEEEKKKKKERRRCSQEDRTEPPLSGVVIKSGNSPATSIRAVDPQPSCAVDLHSSPVSASLPPPS